MISPRTTSARVAPSSPTEASEASELPSPSGAPIQDGFALLRPSAGVLEGCTDSEAASSASLCLFAITCWPLSALMLPLFVGLRGTRVLVANLGLFGSNPADANRATPGALRARLALLVFHNLPVLLLIAAALPWLGSDAPNAKTTTWHMVWMQLVLVILALLARRLAVFNAVGRIAQRTGRLPHRAFLPSTVTLSGLLLEESFPLSISVLFSGAFRALRIPTDALLMVVTRRGYERMRRVLADVGVDRLPRLDAVIRECPSGIVQQPEASPSLVCTPSCRSDVQPPAQCAPGILDAVEDVQVADHVALGADMIIAPFLSSLAAAHASATKAALVFLAVEVASVGVPFAVRAAQGEPLLGRSEFEASAYILLSLTQVAVSLFFGPLHSGAAVLVFFNTAAEKMSRWGTFPTPDNAEAFSVSVDATGAGGSLTIDAIHPHVAEPSPGRFPRYLRQEPQRGLFARARKVLAPLVPALVGVLPLDTPTSCETALRFTTFLHAAWRTPELGWAALTAAVAPICSVVASSALLLYYTASPRSLFSLVYGGSPLQRAAIFPATVFLLALITNASVLLLSMRRAMRRVKRVRQSQVNLMAWRVLAVKRITRLTCSLARAEGEQWQDECMHVFRAAQDREQTVLELLQVFSDQVSHNLAHERGLRFLGVFRPSALRWGALLLGTASVAVLALRLAVTAYGAGV